MSYVLRASAIFIALLLFSAVPGTAGAEGLPAGACPPGMLCDRALGIAIAPPAGWTRLPRVPASEIDFAHLHAGSQEGYIRLVIRAFALTSDTNAARAASRASSLLVAAFPGPHGRLTRSRVRYAGATGLLVRGLPATPQPALQMLLVHGRHIYLIIAPGSALASGQRKALASLRFVPLAGAFPIQPHLTVQPQPAALGQRLHLTLTGVQPNRPYRFIAARSHTGFGGGTMGTRQADALGSLTFGYPGFTAKQDAGLWWITVYGPRGGRVTSASVEVQG